MDPREAINHLKSVPMTEKAIGDAVGASQSTINKIGRGEMVPNWHLGAALVQLAAATPVPNPDDPDAGRIAPPVETA